MPVTKPLPLTCGATLLLTGCHSGPDYTPIGDGLKAIGICLVVYGVVQALAELIQSEQPKTPPTKPAAVERPNKPKATRKERK